MKLDDPAYFMLEDGLKNPDKVAERRKKSIYKAGCYICDDPEFALMGLPLCKPCIKCGAHAAADDDICDNGHSQREE